MPKDTEKLILKYALQNAVFYNGKADPGAVLRKIMAEQAGLRKDVGRVKKAVEQAVKEVNFKPLGKQKEMLGKLAPELLERKVKEQGLPELKGAVVGKVKTRFAPAPTGPLHIFHLLRAAFLSYLYAKKYKGRLVLRLEDSDPRKVRKEFYKWIKEDLKAVGIKWDELVLESDHMDSYYRHAERLIKTGKAYVCFCPAEKFRELKLEKEDCPCRRKGGRGQEEWKGMLEGRYKEGEAVLRFKTSMRKKNPVLRDPPLLRVIKTSHPLKGDRYKVWPLYNFACALEDHHLGITHVFRAKEHEHNTAIQKLIYDAFGWKMPVVVNFGMIYLPGEKIHTRVIKEGLKSGKYTGWDDVRLPTVRAFLRRGFHPRTFEELARSCGLTKTDVKLGVENVEGINRKIIDPIANRYMAVLKPVRISVKGVKSGPVKLDRHPDFPKRGKRSIPVKPDEVYISGGDYKELKNKTFRLIGLGNFRLKGKAAECRGDRIVRDMQKIQWASSPNVKVAVLKQDGELRGLGEPEMGRLKIGDLIQMNRVGFGRVDSKGREIVVAFAHK